MTTPLPSRLRESARELRDSGTTQDSLDWREIRDRSAARIAAELEQAADALGAGPLTLDQRYWLDRRAEIIAALAANGLQICSDKERVWLRRIAAPAAQVAQEGGGVASTTAADDLLETLEDMARQHCHTSAKGETDSGALSTNAQVLRLLAKTGRFRIDREAGRMVIGYWPENDPKLAPGVATDGGDHA